MPRRAARANRQRAPDQGAPDLLTYGLKAPKADGTTELALSPMALLDRLARLIPQEGRHLTRYFGVLSSGAEWRSRIVPILAGAVRVVSGRVLSSGAPYAGARLTIEGTAIAARSLPDGTFRIAGLPAGTFALVAGAASRRRLSSRGLRWLHRALTYLDASRCPAYLPGMSNLVKFSSQLDEKVLDALRALAASSGRTLASVLNEAATDYLERATVRPAFRKSLEEVLDEHHEVLARLAR